MQPRERERVGEGVQAEVFLLADGSVLKLWRHAADQPAVDREAAALRVLADHAGLAPALLAVKTEGDRPGIIMERVTGAGLAAILRSRPWAVASTARVLAGFHAAIHAIEAPPTLPPLNDELRRKIVSADDLPPQLGKFALQTLERLPQGDRLCHGDFHIANVLGTADRPVAIDWPNASRGDPIADVAHTNVLHTFGQPREGINRLERTAVKVGRRAFGRRYLGAYRLLNPIDGLILEAWETVRAAARVAAEVPGEVQDLIRFLEHRRAAAAS